MSVPVHLSQREALGYITYRRGTLGAYRYDCLPALPPPPEGRRPDITSVTESGEIAPSHPSSLLDVHATDATLLMLPSLLAGQHGVVDVAVAGVQGVVVSERHAGTVA